MKRFAILAAVVVAIVCLSVLSADAQCCKGGCCAQQAQVAAPAAPMPGPGPHYWPGPHYYPTPYPYYPTPYVNPVPYVIPTPAPTTPVGTQAVIGGVLCQWNGAQWVQVSQAPIVRKDTTTPDATAAGPLNILPNILPFINGGGGFGGGGQQQPTVPGVYQVFRGFRGMMGQPVATVTYNGTATELQALLTQYPGCTFKLVGAMVGSAGPGVAEQAACSECGRCHLFHRRRHRQ